MRFAADEDFDNHILRAVLRQVPHFEVARVQDAGLSGADDSSVLEWASREGRVLLTHDVSTMTSEALKRVNSGLPMPGVIVVRQLQPMREVIEDLVLIAEAGEMVDWENRIQYLPL